MPSQFFGLNIGASALFTSQVAVNTTANNISNVQTEGYSRQVTDIRATAAMRTHAKYGSCGTGVEAVKITQERDLYYDDKFWANGAKVGYYDELNYYMNQIQEAFKDDSVNTGFTTIFNNMFNALDTLKTNAADENVRNQFIHQAQMLCTYFNSISASLDMVQEDCNEEIRNQVNNINSMARKIATLNKEINVIEVNGGYANELRDQRANLIDQLSAVVKVETKETEVQNTHGDNLGGTNFVLMINGQVLVDTSEYRELECYVDDYSNNQTDIEGLYSIRWKDTGTQFAATAESADGCLKALYMIRDGNNAENLKGTVSASDMNSVTISGLSNNEVNALNIPPEGKITIKDKVYTYKSWSAELDENGNMTSVKFELEDPITEREAAYLMDAQLVCGQTVDYMGCAYYQSQINEFLRTFTEMFNAIEQDGETLNGEQMGSFFHGITANGTTYDFSDWKNGTQGEYPKTIDSSSDSYYRLTAKNVAVNQKSIKDPGYFSTAKTMTDGKDAFDLVEDLKALQSDVIMFRGDKAGSFLATLLSDISVETQKTETFFNNYNNLSLSIDNMRKSISGVDEDEEALNLIKFQNAYNLASKIISVMNEMYGKLINETGV